MSLLGDMAPVGIHDESVRRTETSSDRAALLEVCVSELSSRGASYRCLQGSALDATDVVPWDIGLAAGHPLSIWTSRYLHLVRQGDALKRCHGTLCGKREPIGGFHDCR